VNIGLVVPGFSADADDWCIPALRNLVRELAAAADVRVFALRYPHCTARYEVFGVPINAFGGGEALGRDSVRLWWRTGCALAAEHRHRPFDVLHGFWAGEAGFVTALVGLALRIPTVVSIGGGELACLPDIGYGGRLRRVERTKTRLAVSLADSVTAGSALGVTALRPWLGRGRGDRVRRIPLGVDATMFAPAPARVADRPPRLLHVASLVPVKDQATLLYAAAALQRRGYRFQLDIAGSGPGEGQLRSLAARLGIDALLRWRGEIGHDRLAGAYRETDVFVLSSRHEAQGMVALEAAACGLPVAGTHVGVLPELAPAGARIASVGDADGLADGIAAFLDDDGARRHAGEAARMMAETEFELARCTSRFLKTYTSVAGGRVKQVVAGLNA
jgi:glycosyltransferase involved in cell wall biosynthesis